MLPYIKLTYSGDKTQKYLYTIIDILKITKLTFDIPILKYEGVTE